MKKIVLLFAVFFALTQMRVFAQATDQEVVNFNVHLLSTFNLNVDGIDQEVTFATPADYNNGVTEAGGIVPGYTDISMETTGNWNLVISAPDCSPIAPATGSIPIDNLGVWVEATGTNNFGNGAVTTLYDAAANAMGMTVADQELIGLGSGNAGDISDNAFVLHWLFGTRQGTMHQPETMFDQLTAGVFSLGDFTTTATLTLTEIP